MQYIQHLLIFITTGRVIDIKRNKVLFMVNEGIVKLPNKFITECKNHNKKVDVTWVGKFYSLMNLTDNSLGILFSYKGLTGKN